MFPLVALARLKLAISTLRGWRLNQFAYNAIVVLGKGIEPFFPREFPLGVLTDRRTQYVKNKYRGVFLCHLVRRLRNAYTWSMFVTCGNRTHIRRAGFPTALNLYAHTIKLSATPLLFVVGTRFELVWTGWKPVILTLRWTDQISNIICY